MTTLTSPRRSLLEALYMPGMEDIDLDLDRPETQSSLRIPDFDRD